MTDQDETDGDRTGEGGPATADGSPGAPRPAPLIEILDRVETAGEALRLLAEAYPDRPTDDLLAMLNEQAAALRRKAASIECLSLVLEEVMRRLGAGGTGEREP